MTLKLSSPAFSQDGKIPRGYTREGDDNSPALEWTGAPAGTASFALIVDDPDAPDPEAPKMTYVHWVVYNIPASAKGLPSGGEPLPAGAHQGTNDWNEVGYGGPEPPIGRHRYFFKLYALDTMLDRTAALKKPELEAAMKGHVLEQTELMGTYKSGDPT